MKTELWTVFSILLLHNIREVTPQFSPWYPDQCDDPYYFKCGDICLFYKHRCSCGGDDWSWYDDREDKRYCCVPPGGSQCTKDGDNDLYFDVRLNSDCNVENDSDYNVTYNSDYNVTCSSGVLLPWYQPCHDNSCDGSPVIKKNNCQYDCLARTDEVSDKHQSMIDQYEDIQNCTRCGNPGLTGSITSGECKLHEQWCTEHISCHSEVSRDRLQLQRFCQNSTFWESQGCNDYLSDGTVGVYGERCRGSQQHCYYPAYLNYYYETLRAAGYLPQCKDKSDQIFERHSQCNMSAHLDIYCEKCQDNSSHPYWRYKKGADCEPRCADKTRFIQEQTDPNKTINCDKYLEDPDRYWESDQHKNDVLDPHNCQASCLKPGYGCTACENKKYFNCSSSSKCLHPDLVCDGVPQCPPVPPSTEPEDEELERCKQKKEFRSDAIMKCQSIFYPEVTILAVPCNGVPECHNNADEPWICQNTLTIISSGLLSVFVTIITVFAFFKLKYLQRKIIDIHFGKVLIFKIKEWHDNESFRSFGIFPLLAVNSVTLQNEILEKIAEEEKKFNKANEFQNMLWIKNTYSKFEIKEMALYLYPSVLKKIYPIRFVLEKFEKLTYSFEIFWWLFNKVRQISFVYIDLTKDILITATLLSMIGIKTLIDSPTAFPSVVVMCLIVSIALPLLLSSLQLARYHPDIIYGEDFYKQSRWRQVLGRIAIILMAFINPALFIHAYESNQEQLKFQDLREAKFEKIKKIGKQGKVIQNQYVKFIKTEMASETIIQISGQIILLLQSETSSSTVSGLETVFGKCDSGIDADTLIILSILWSIKTCVTLHLKAADIEKTHLRIWSTLGLVLISLFCSCARLLSFVCFFTPFLGLFNLLNHYKAEQIPFAQSIRGDFNGNITWGEIDRWTFDDETELGTPPGYNKYTLFTLAESVQLFAILIFLQILAVYMVKVMKAEKFREADKLEKLLHVMENLNIPYPVEDFDVENGREREHRERFNKVNTEVVLTMLFNMLIHLLMLAPLWYTGNINQENLRYTMNRVMFCFSLSSDFKT